MGHQERENNAELERIDIIEFLQEYVKKLCRMWVWLVIFSLLGAGLFYARVQRQYVPVYTASATFAISIWDNQQSSSSAYYDNAAAEQMATTFPYILTSGVLRRQVEADVGESVATGSIKAVVANNTNLLTLSVTSVDPESAYEVLQSVIKNYPSLSEVIVGRVNMALLDETGIPTVPDNPRNFTRQIIKGALCGVILVAGWAALKLFTRRTIRKESDVQERMHIKCFGAVPQITAKKRSNSLKWRIVLTEPRIEGVLREPLRIIRNKVERYVNESGKKVFLVTSALAGEGKSTVAVNLALSLAQAGHKVVLIDCDLRHPSGREILGIKDGNGLGEVLTGKAEINDCMLRANELGLGKDMNVMIIPGGKPVEGGSELLESKKMGALVEIVKKWADYVILDSAPAGLLTDAVVLAQYADAAIFVVRKDYAKVDYIMDGMEQLAESGISIIGGVLNGV
ncbi:MAG: formate--tetrahydrofolate ligase [Lachnospiraceae bacterium]|nr:formate--tetrahydrofolate ligase [Lachnospiraceae bacterium]